MTRVPANVLKARGVPFRFHSLETTDTGDLAVPYRRKVNESSDDLVPVMEDHWLSFTNSVLADLEDDEIGWGSHDAWQDALRSHPFRTINATVALLLQLWVPGVATPSGSPIPDVRRAGVMIPDGTFAAISTCIGAAFAISMGTPPEEAGKLLQRGLAKADSVSRDIAERMRRSLAEINDEELEEDPDTQRDTRVGSVTWPEPNEPVTWQEPAGDTPTSPSVTSDFSPERPRGSSSADLSMSSGV